MKRIVGLFLTLTIAGLCQSVVERYEFLEPVDQSSAKETLHDVYEVELKEILLRGADATSPAMMITRPAFSAESLVQIVETDAKMFVRSATASKSIWYSRVMMETGQKKRRVTVKSAEKELRQDIAMLVIQVCSLACAQARQPEVGTLGFDGVTYIFSSADRSGKVTKGQTWSPQEGTICGKLVTLGYHLREYANNKETSEHLGAESRELLDLLKAKSH